ncbi:MAG: class I SAM-dependent methyltransferase [Deltaproteobacteria bacterium]|nr:class I SAM-dependent methyltransferase [Deltaproteobacteria bacterium]
MPLWVIIVMILMGALFAAKLLYVLGTGGLLPLTQGAIFVSTSTPRIQATLDAVPMRPGERLYDLGCGDGRVLRAMVGRYDVQAVGFEVNPVAYLVAKALSVATERVRICYGNFWSKDLSDADVVFCYLFPDLMERLALKLHRELRPGCRVVSCNFPLSGWTPTQILHPTAQRHADPIYLYEVPGSTVPTGPVWISHFT